MVLLYKNIAKSIDNEKELLGFEAELERVKKIVNNVTEIDIQAEIARLEENSRRLFFEIHEVSKGIYNNIADWTRKEIFDYIKYKNSKYNELKNKQNGK